mgnify:CR=1 FL=1
MRLADDRTAREWRALGHVVRRARGGDAEAFRAIVEAHRGSIRAENREPRGARFVFTLPLDEQPPLVHDEEDHEIGTPGVEEQR